MVAKRLNIWLILVVTASVLTSCLSRPERLRTSLPSSSSSTKNHPSSGNMCHKYADIIGVDARSLNNYVVYRYIDEWMGTRHRLGGRSEKGIDSSAFTHHMTPYVHGHCLTR